MKAVYIPREFKEVSFSEENKTNIASGEEYFFELDTRFNYDDVQITNLNKDNDCTITTNYSIKQILPAGNSINMNTRKVYDYIKIKNIGSSQISVGEIQIYLTHTSKKGEVIGKLTSLIPIINLIR